MSTNATPSQTESELTEERASELTLDCRRFVVAVKPSARIFLSMRSTTITL